MNKIFEHFPQTIEGEVLSKEVEGQPVKVENADISGHHEPETPGLKKTMTQAEMDAFLARNGGAKQSAAMQGQLNQMMASMGSKEPSDEEKEEETTVNFSTRSDFTPPPSLFIGIGNTNDRYKKWLAAHFKEMLDGMGQDPAAKGYSKAKHIKASQFLRTCVYINNLYKKYRTVKFKLVGPDFPRAFDYIGSVEELVRLNKDILNAIAPMFNMGDAVKDPVKAGEEAAKNPQETPAEAVVDVVEPDTTSKPE